MQITQSMNNSHQMMHDCLPLTFSADDLTIYIDRRCFAIVKVLKRYPTTK